MKALTRSLLLLGFALRPTLGQAQSEVRFGGMMISTRQNVLSSGPIVQASASLTGAEFLAQNQSMGFYARYLTGAIGSVSARSQSGELRMAEGRLMIGAQIFSVEAGFALRARSASLGEPRDKLIRGGARSSIPLGPSGFSVSLSVGAYARSDSVPTGGTSGSNDKKFGLVGWEAVTAVIYQAPRRLPFYVMLGYRYERLRSEDKYIPIRREELSGIQLGIGIRHVTGKKAATPPAATPTP